MDNEITVRRATLADLDDTAVLFDLYRIFYLCPSDIAAANNFLRQRMEKEESAIFVAAVDEKLVGFVQLYPIFSSVGMKRCWLLNDLYVHGSARSMGVGGKLLEAAKQHGLATDSRWLILETASDNFTAQSVYEKNGWKKMSGYFYEMRLAE